ncbi:MAG: hypothetical protein ACO388_01075 [Saprospiraceae bacterium]|jgi:hypothetical protein
MKVSLFTILVVTLIAYGCSSGKAALTRGDYYEAVNSSLERLQQNPNNTKALETFQEAYPRFLTYLNNKVNNITPSSEIFKWETLYDLYVSGNKLYNKIQKTPAALDLVSDPVYYSSELEKAKIKSAEVRYQLGSDLLSKTSKKDRQAALEAYKHFERTEFFYPGFRDVEAKKSEALERSILIVNIDPLVPPVGSLELDVIFFYNQVVAYLKDEVESEFIKFEPNNSDADHTLSLRFEKMVIGATNFGQKEVERIRDSVVVGTVKVQEEGRTVEKEVFGKVMATVKQFEKSVFSEAVLEVLVIDNYSGVTLSQKRFPGSFIWVDYWGYFKGDERALTEEDKKRIMKDYELPNPKSQDFFIEATKPIFYDFSYFIQRFFRDFNP